MKPDYYKNANNFLAKTNTKFNAKYLKHDYHFFGDDEKRDIYQIELKRGSKSYSFEFGQSSINKNKKPDPAFVMACLVKDNNEKALLKLFDYSELEQLQEIN